MRRHTRFMSVAIFAGLVTVVGASLTWACTPSTFGTPATPAAPPTPSAIAPPSPTATPPGGGVVTPSPVTVNVNRLPAASTGTSGSGSTSGATAPVRNTGGNGNLGSTRSEGVNRTQGGRGALAPGGSDTSTSFSQRASGATAGTTSRGGQPVFAAAGAAKSKAASSDKRAAASTPSTRSASGDLWSGFKPAQRASVLQASAAPQPDGMSGTAVAALAVLGLGLTGIAGAMAFVVLRTRRAKSGSTTEM